MGRIVAVGVVWEHRSVDGDRPDRRPRVFANFGNPLAWVGPFMTANAIVFLLLTLRFNQEGRAFLFSSFVWSAWQPRPERRSIPNLVPAVDAARSLTVDGAHSSDTALTMMLIVALIGMPIVLGYTSFIYWKFKARCGSTKRGIDRRRANATRPSRRPRARLPVRVDLASSNSAGVMRGRISCARPL